MWCCSHTVHKAYGYGDIHTLTKSIWVQRYSHTDYEVYGYRDIHTLTMRFIDAEIFTH